MAMNIFSPFSERDFYPYQQAEASTAADKPLEKSTPPAPPGLAFPTSRSRQQHSLLNDAEHLMPELGRISSARIDEKPAATNAARSEPNLRPANRGKETTVAPTTDEAAFPALPKPTRPPPSVNTASLKEPNVRVATKPHEEGAQPGAQPGARSENATTAKFVASSVPVKPGNDTSNASSLVKMREAGGSNQPAMSSEQAQQQPEVQKVTGVPQVTPASKQRQHPGKLDISAAQEFAPTSGPVQRQHVENIERTDSPARSAIEQSSATPSMSSRSGTPGPSETISRRSAQPRTLRVLATPTPKTETPPPFSTTSTTAPPLPAVPKIGTKSTAHSRQASSASVVPETPASEKQIPDSASATTESQSRASSPPLTANKVGSAPIRAKTKNQQKKERKERMQDERTESVSESGPQPEIVQEPIVGRKTKAKKPKPVQPPKSRRNISAEKKTSQETELVEEAKTVEAQTPPAPVTVEPVPEKPPPQQEEPKQPEPETKEPSLVNKVIDSLQASGDIPADFLERMFKSTNFGLKSFAAGDLKTPAPMTPLTSQEMQQLNSGRAIRRSADNAQRREGKEVPLADRVLITPYSRLCLRGLPKDIEDRMLELDERVSKSIPPKKYSHRPTSDQAAIAAKLVDELLRAMAQAMMQTETVDETPETTKVQQSTQANNRRPPAYADDALAYLNQFILPLSSSRGGNGIIPTMNVPTHGATADGHPAGDPLNISAPYTNEQSDWDLRAPDSAVSGSYNIRDLPHATSSLRSTHGGTTELPVLPSTTATPSRKASSTQPSNPSPNLNLKPLTDLAASLPPLAASYAANLDANSGQAARDALAASLGAASSTLASVASDAAAAVSRANKAGENPGMWQTRGLESLHLAESIKDMPNMANLPQDVMNLSAEAIKQAIATAAPHLNAPGSATGSGRRSSMSQIPRGSVGGRSKGRREPDDAAKIMGELEAALVASRKELESVERKLSGIVKRNRRAVGV
ncbi:MAG: hypothetical protein Q9162_000544 [Coniocarpon cinnabarinum]